MTLEHALIAAVAALAAAVGALWKIQRDDHRDCEAHNKELWGHIIALEKRACGDRDCPLRQARDSKERPRMRKPLEKD